VFGHTVRFLMLVFLTTSHPAWLPVAWAQPVKLLPPVAMDSTGNFVVVWGTYTGKYNVGGQHGDGGPNNQAEPAVAMDSAGNLVVVWLSDVEPRVGHRSTAFVGYSADTAPGRERRVRRETQETSAQAPHEGEFMKTHVPSVPIHPSPSSSWNGGSRLP